MGYSVENVEKMVGVGCSSPWSSIILGCDWVFQFLEFGFEAAKISILIITTSIDGSRFTNDVLVGVRSLEEQTSKIFAT